MTVQQLIAELEDLDPETEVRIASQPKWPFEYDIDMVIEVDGEEGGEEEEKVVYLAEGTQLGYLPEEAAKTLKRQGWTD